MIIKDKDVFTRIINRTVWNTDHFFTIKIRRRSHFDHNKEGHTFAFKTIFHYHMELKVNKCGIIT